MEKDKKDIKEIEKKQTSNKGLIVLILILLFIIFGLVGYIVYDMELEKEKISSNISVPNNKNDATSVIEDEVKKIKSITYSYDYNPNWVYPKFDILNEKDIEELYLIYKNAIPEKSDESLSFKDSQLKFYFEDGKMLIINLIDEYSFFVEGSDILYKTKNNENLKEILSSKVKNVLNVVDDSKNIKSITYKHSNYPEEEESSIYEINDVKSMEKIINMFNDVIPGGATSGVGVADVLIFNYKNGMTIAVSIDEDTFVLNTSGIVYSFNNDGNLLELLSSIVKE